MLERIAIGDVITGNAAYVTEQCKVRLEEYPHLFRLMAWYEEREPDEMPDYLKCTATPDQIIIPGMVLFIRDWPSNWYGKAGNKVCIMGTGCYLPATESEYTSYINSLK